MKVLKRIGQIVPSSNTTMETEIPAILRAREAAGIGSETFTFHSSRMRMKKVTKDELAAMDRDSIRCAAELADAPVDVVGYACLVAIMSMGRGYHRQSEAQLGKVLADEGRAVAVVTSAGALVDELKRSGAQSISLVTPYMRPLTDLVVDYIRHEGIAVVDSIAAIQSVEDKLALPVTSAAICTTRKMLTALGLEAVAPDAGYFLSPKNLTAGTLLKKRANPSQAA
jgi:maleate isomerase